MGGYENPLFICYSTTNPSVATLERIAAVFGAKLTIPIE